VRISVNNRNPAVFDLHRVNLRTGERSVVETNNDNFASYLSDNDFNVRFAQRYNPEGGIDVFQKDKSGQWQPMTTIPMEDALTSGPVGISKDGKRLYMLDSRNSNTGALVSYDLATGKSTVLASNDKADASGALVNPITEEIEAVSFNYTRNEWTYLDKEIEAEFKAIREKIGDGEIALTSRSRDDSVWTIALLDDNGPVRYYLYDRASDSPTFLFTNNSRLEGLPLSPMHPVVIESRDGLDLVSYLTLPSWLDANEDMVPDSGPIPMVLLVHGGPWARDAWGFSGQHQWLANRGYAVLSVNFRGSTGFGKDFINASNLEWGTKMHDDLIDAVNWAVENGVAQRDKVAIMGGSYGGYATLAGLTFTPDVFAAGVDIVGPSNLITLLETIPPYWAPMRELFYKRMGDSRTEEGLALLKERSPLNHADKIKKPLLIGQGANDPRVKQAESDQIVQAMVRQNIPVTYALFTDEGHGFARPENRFAFYAVAENFLAQHLKGRAQPITAEDFENSSLQVPEGVMGVRGLADALANHKATEKH
jgi:dipeptidyl aminopeptidase/acylaminoacyl peptidase